ncbi:MAG TPA: hypothetical protein V6D11_15575 [Waterburya sp.]
MNVDSIGAIAPGASGVAPGENQTQEDKILNTQVDKQKIYKKISKLQYWVEPPSLENMNEPNQKQRGRGDNSLTDI